MYELIGKILVYGFEISAIIVIIALGIGYAALRRKVYFCGLFADILDFFYYPLLSIFSWFNKEKELDMIMVNLKNYANKEKFAASKNRIIIGGQCSRHLDCPASSTREGIKCVSCGRCSFSKIKDKAERDKFLDWVFGMEYNVNKMPKPDLIIYLDVPVELGQELVFKKGERDYIGGVKQDIHEKDTEFLKRSEEIYKGWAEKDKDWFFRCAIIAVLYVA